MGDIGVIYRIRCLENDRAYIGSTRVFASRRSGHLYLLRNGRHHSLHLQRSYDKHGENSLVFEIIEDQISVDKLLERETFHITTLKPLFNGSAVSATRRGSKQSDACKAKVSAANTGRVMTLSFCEGLRRGLIGNRRSVGNRNAMKVTPEIRLQIAQLTESGLGSYRIAKLVGLSKKTVVNVRRGRHSYG